MPKRDATTELNHDNWDQEDESEEAGEFKKASEDQMKVKKFYLFEYFLYVDLHIQGRVIKKAKRRNLTEDQKKNIFASFGGFTSSNNVDAADAFSFLAAPPAKTESNGAQEESSQNGEEKTEAKTDENKENDTNIKTDSQAPVDDLFAKFMKPKTGSWTCEVCMVSNPGDRDTCLACETPRPGAVDKSKTDTPKVDPPPAVPVDDLFAKFMKPKAAGSWTCEVCMVSNPADRDTCLACETPRPGVTIKSKDDSKEKEQTQSFQFGESGGFKFGSTTST